MTISRNYFSLSGISLHGSPPVDKHSDFFDVQFFNPRQSLHKFLFVQTHEEAAVHLLSLQRLHGLLDEAHALKGVPQVRYRHGRHLAAAFMTRGVPQLRYALQRAARVGHGRAEVGEGGAQREVILRADARGRVEVLGRGAGAGGRKIRGRARLTTRLQSASAGALTGTRVKVVVTSVYA